MSGRLTILVPLIVLGIKSNPNSKELLTKRNFLLLLPYRLSPNKRDRENLVAGSEANVHLSSAFLTIHLSVVAQVLLASLTSLIKDPICRWWKEWKKISLEIQLKLKSAIPLKDAECE